MAIDFPNSPSLNQVFEANGRYWQWDGNSWNAYYNQAAAEKHGGSHSLAGTDPINISQSQVSNLTTDLGNKAPLASPTFTGTVTAPTLSSTTANITTGNITNLTASTSAALPADTTIGVVSPTELSYLDGVTSALQTQLNAKANLASPTFTGTPAAPTAAAGTNTTQVATTAFVQTAVSPFTGRNRIINGDFSVWQRGTSFSNPSNGSYLSDRWIALWDGTGATRTVSQQAFLLGNVISGYEPSFFFRWAQTVAGSGGTFNVLSQRIEDVRTFAGQTITVSFWAKSSSSQNVTVSFDRSYGTGGSSTDFAQNSNVFNFTNSWQRFQYTTNISSLSGKTIGANSFIQLNFAFAPNVAQTYDIWGVQVESGSVATPFEVKPYADQLRDCQRYFISYPNPPLRGVASGSGAINRCGTTLPVTMRTTPSTPVISGSLLWYDGVNTGTITNSNVVSWYTTPTVIELDANPLASGSTSANRPIIFYVSGGSGSISVSAEL